MENREAIKTFAIQCIKEEATEINRLQHYIDDNFVCSIEAILATNGRVVITGIGKSAIIARKIVASLNSTGTPALFLHAADAIHGDIGMVREDDIIICISKSGNTPEIKALLPIAKPLVKKIIALVGDITSYLATHADYVIPCTVEKEACPNNLAPTSSTTAQLVMGDAIVVTLLQCKEFKKEDFARYHPGGSLGKTLYLRAADLVIKNEKPTVEKDTPINQVIIEITSKRLGATAVLENGKIIGIITDGDLRRMLGDNKNIPTTTAADIMSSSPYIISSDILAADALSIMRNNEITQLLVVDHDTYIGVIHIHDILNEGII